MCKIKNNLFIVQEKLKQYNYNKNKIFYSSNPSVRQDCEAVKGKDMTYYMPSHYGKKKKKKRKT